MKKYIRKADIILFIVLVVIGLAASAALSMSRTEAGKNAKVIIESNGKAYAEYSAALAVIVCKLVYFYHTVHTVVLLCAFLCFIV